MLRQSHTCFATLATTRAARPRLCCRPVGGAPVDAGAVSSCARHSVCPACALVRIGACGSLVPSRWTSTESYAGAGATDVHAQSEPPRLTPSGRNRAVLPKLFRLLLAAATLAGRSSVLSAAELGHGSAVLRGHGGVGYERRSNSGRCAGRTAEGLASRGAGRGACGCASRVCDRFASAVIARHGCWSGGARDVLVARAAVGRAMRPTRA